MCNFAEKLFFQWYPSTAKTPRTAAGRRVKKAMILALVVHIILFFFSFAVVGFNSMLLNLIMSAWTYSITLTLRERQLVFYLLCLGIGTLEGIYSLLWDSMGNLQILGKMVNVVIYIVISYFVIKNYYMFRQSGGLHGKAKDVTEKMLNSEGGKAVTKKGKEVLSAADAKLTEMETAKANEVNAKAA